MLRFRAVFTGTFVDMAVLFSSIWRTSTRLSFLTSRYASSISSTQFVDDSFFDDGSSPSIGRSRGQDGTADTAGGQRAHAPQQIHGSHAANRHQHHAPHPRHIHGQQHAVSEGRQQPAEIILTKMIKACSGPSDVLLLVRKQDNILNPIHISAFLTRLAASSTSPSGRRATPGGDVDEERLTLHTILAFLTAATQNQLPFFEARQLANSAWGIAKMVSSGMATMETASPLVSILMQQASGPGGLSGVQPSELSLLAWAAFTMRHHDPQLLESLAKATVNLDISILKDHEAVNLLRPFAAAKHPSPRLLGLLCSHLLGSRRLEAMDARLVQQLSFACSSMQCSDADFVSGLASRAAQLLDQYSPVQLCGLVASLSGMRCSNEELYCGAAGRVMAALQSGSEMEPRHMSLLLLGLFSAFDRNGSDGLRLVTNSLTDAALPTLLKSSRLKDCARAVLALSAGLEAGNAPLAEGLRIMISRLTANLQRGSEQMPASLIASLIRSLPAIMRSTAVHAAGQEVVASHEEGTDLDSYSAALRHVALSRLGEFPADERPALLKALLDAADVAGGSSSVSASRRGEAGTS